MSVSTYLIIYLTQSFFLKWANPASFLFIFGLFQTNINTILQQINVKKMSIQYTAPGFEPMTFRT